MRITAETLIELIEDTGRAAMSYSGRCMYGARCVAIDVDRNEEPLLVVAEMAKAAAEDDDDGVTLDAFVYAMQDVRTDALGLGAVVYWPNIAWPEGRKEDGE